MNFYHFRPSCKVIKRSRASRGPFFTNFDDEDVKEILTSPNVNILNGEINLLNFGIKYHYSKKVFIGGLPLDITEEVVLKTFTRYGDVMVDWPYKEDTNSIIPPKGFAFLLFEDNHSVDLLMSYCERRNGGYFIKLSSPKVKNKNIQVRPWKISSTDHLFIENTADLDKRNTIFVGGVPRTITAEDLGILLTRLFGNVAYVGIDTDAEFMYPKGSARVTFESTNSVLAAIKKRFLMRCETKMQKMMEIKPYILDDQSCDKCDTFNPDENNATLFCPEVDCLTYLCEFCWATEHNSKNFSHHKPLIKQGLEDYMNSLKLRGFDSA